MTDIWQWSAAETAAAVRERRVSAVEVTEAAIARMRAANPAINAVVVDLSDQALAAAKAADAAQAAGDPPGPLHGVPVTIKINIDVEGQANSNGVPGLAGVIAPGDSPVTANLRKAGAIVIGQTNTPEFSLRAFTDNPLHGQTLNPWDPAITCGGSSGGAGASIAAGIGAVAHGNDIGGSLRWPAAVNGVCTIKPTLGRVPAFNPSATAERPPMAQLMSVQGPICREVADVRLALAAMSRRDPRDPWWVPAPLEGPPVARRVAKAKMPDDLDCDARVLALVDRAADHLADGGYEVVEVEVPDISGTWKLWCDLISTEIETLQAAQMRELGSAPFIGALEGITHMATILDGPGYMRAVAHRAKVLRDWLAFLEEFPVILAPVTVRPTPAFDADLKGDAAVRQIFWNDLRFVGAISVLGLPVAVTPAGLLDGHPVGVQLIGSRYREDVCLDAAAAIEAKVGVLARSLWAR
ncbi:MAG: amidase family protein [Phenylobacterium sp.]|uniref:amidase family protein n=1 Tax=Phenylobacterium sp. TaxID=1871053 RepID=UPI001A5856D3|nr:amidase family protein [Phenylobacterium sp.]MBL8773644.1 amidase family protein [Phenylobacterium sp.]